MIKNIGVLACALGLLVPAVASAEDTKPLWKKMDKATTVFESKGFGATAWEKQGEAPMGGHFDLPIRLDAGVEYRVIALCGPACTNLDLQVLSASGKVLASDSEGDAIPIGTYKPTASGDYTVRVLMTACSASPCAFVTKAFMKN